jgi:hypothetical protein
MMHASLDTGTLMNYAGSLIPGQNGVVAAAKLKLRENAKRDIISYGPFILPPNKVRPEQSSGSDISIAKLWIGRFHANGGRTQPPMRPSIRWQHGRDVPKRRKTLPCLQTHGPQRLRLGQKPQHRLLQRLHRSLQQIECCLCQWDDGGDFEWVYLHHAVTMDLRKAVLTFVKEERSRANHIPS